MEAVKYLTGNQMLFNKLGFIYQSPILHCKQVLIRFQIRWGRWILSNSRLFLKNLTVWRDLILLFDFNSNYSLKLITIGKGLLQTMTGNFLLLSITMILR